MNDKPIADRAVVISVTVEVLESHGEQPFIFAENAIRSRFTECRSITTPAEGVATPVVDQLMLLVDQVGRSVDAAYPARRGEGVG